MGFKQAGDIAKKILQGEWEGIGHVALGYADEGGIKAAAERKDSIYWIK